MTMMAGKDYGVMCSSINTHTGALLAKVGSEGVEGQGGGDERRSVRGCCAPCPIKSLARPPRTPWEEAPAGP